jgi:hypothetical protein
MPAGDPVFTRRTLGGFCSGAASAAPFFVF